MMGASHAMSGAVAGLACCAVAQLAGHGPSLTAGAVVVAGMAVGALVPDLDHPRAMLTRGVPVVGPVACWVLRRASRAAYLATRSRWDDDTEGTHRYLTHTAVFAALVGLAGTGVSVLAGLWWWLGWPVAAGCLVHLWGDWLTRMGVPVLWPMRVRGKRWWRFRAPLTFRTGSAWESVVVVALGFAGLGSAWVLVVM